MHSSALPTTLFALVTLGACGLVPEDPETTTDASTVAADGTGTTEPAATTGAETTGVDTLDTADSGDTSGGSTDDGTVDTSGGETPIDAPSCEGLETQCAGESCCTAISMPGGTARVGRGDTGNDACPMNVLCLDNELPQHDVAVDPFSLDKYAVTVGRFRQFVAAWDDNWRPAVGDGAHPSVPESGWDASWSDLLPGDLRGSLSCADWATWTDEPGFYEDLPIGCLNWYQAHAFCIWDGGRLATEAEYEYVAAGGDENRLYPWGGASPDDTRAVFDDVGNYEILPVGSLQDGAGRWGHLDLAGNMATWAFDCYSEEFYGVPPASEPNAINLPGAGPEPCTSPNPAFFDVHSVRGLGADDEDMLRSTSRQIFSSTDSFASIGVRCARD